jgi:hypothetical protein
MSALNIQRLSLAPGIVPNQHTWPLKVIATSTITGLPSEIFVYQAGKGDDPFSGDRFQCVASVHQVSELGTSPVVTDTKQKPFFRKDCLEFHCRTPEDADNLYNTIVAHAQDLVNNFFALAALTVENTVSLVSTLQA